MRAGRLLLPQAVNCGPIYLFQLFNFASLTDFPVSAKTDGLSMTLTLLTLDYEHLASDELERAALCTTQESRTRHLNRASAYAQRAEEAETGSTQSDGVLDIIGTLSAALDELDGSGLTIPALHINQAIVDLGGIGMSVTTTGLE